MFVSKFNLSLFNPQTDEFNLINHVANPYYQDIDESLRLFLERDYALMHLKLPNFSEFFVIFHDL